MDWYGIKFLESPDNLKETVAKAIGRRLSTSAAVDIATCIQQGRMFFQASERSPIEIRPLMTYYGVVAFTKAVAASRRGESPAVLSQTHGLRDVSSANAKLDELEVSFETSGTLHDLDNAIRPLECVSTTNDEYNRIRFYKPPVAAVGLSGRPIKLKEILSRLPGSKELYERTFGEKSNCQDIYVATLRGASCELKVSHLNPPFDGHAQMVAMVADLRNRFPFLCQWRLTDAARSWDASHFSFSNITVLDGDEFGPDNLTKESDAWYTVRAGSGGEIVDVEDILPYLSGGIIRDHQFAIAPIDGVQLSDWTLMFSASFLLSSLVRYRPQVWVHSVKGRAFDKRAMDDRCLAVVEKVIADIELVFPKLVMSSVSSELP